MTDKEVMQMALDALSEPTPGVRTDFSDALVYREKIKATAEALRAALAQPEKEWKGLTDEEIMSLLPGAVRLPPGWVDTVRAIEAKLKEKNT